MGVNLTNNDFLVFRYAFEHRFVTLDLIQDYILRHMSKDYPRKRMWKLENGDDDPWIRRRSHKWLRNSYYVVSEFTESILMGNDSFKKRIENAVRDNNFNNPVNFREIDKSLYKANTSINLAEFDHNYLLLKTRLILENYGIANDWKTDKMIWLDSYQRRFNDDKKAFKIIPDSEFNYVDSKGNTNKLALELEKTRKKPSRYYDKLKKYAENRSDIDMILWVHFGDEAILSSIQDSIESLIKELKSKKKKSNSDIINNQIKRISHNFFIDFDDIKNGVFVVKNALNGEEGSLTVQKGV